MRRRGVHIVKDLDAATRFRLSLLWRGWKWPAGTPMLVTDWRIGMTNDSYPFNPVAEVVAPDGSVIRDVPEACLIEFHAHASPPR